MKRHFLAAGIVFGLLGWSCSKVETAQLNLRQVLEKNASDINSAVNNISETKGFHVLSLNDVSVAKLLIPVSYKDSITLGLIAGIYEYQQHPVLLNHHMNYPYRLFKKTGTSDIMIVNLPQQMIFHPRYLHNYYHSDSLLENDFKLTASDYHLYYNSWLSADYKVTAGLSLNSEYLGSFDISSYSNTLLNQHNTSRFNFAGGYSISTTWQSGDTARSTFALLKDDKPLLEETTLFTGKSFHKKERQYDLIIGNIEIKRGFGIDSIQVYMDGILQKTAGVKITDSADTTGSICQKRDILLTFDDGTTAKLSSLIDPAIGRLKSLVSSLHNMYFAENIINYIAINIYYNSR